MIQNRTHKRRSLLAGLLLLCLSFIALPLYGQATLGAREIALGQATSALPNSDWSVFENVAMISDNRNELSFFGIRYYGLSSLTDLAAVVTVPISIGVIGGGAHRYGNDKFNKTRLRVVYKNSFENFNYGVAINYNHIVQGKGYGSVGALGIDMGISALITDGLWVGAKATNINQPKYGQINNFEEDLPRNLSIGFSYQLSDVALFSSDVVKDVDFPISYRGGIEVEIVNHLKARAGITTAPQTFSGGFGYNTKSWGVDLVVQKHEVNELGYSPGLDFNISW